MIKKCKKIKFMDFCSGIGGGRLGAEGLGFECVGFSEIDNDAINGYKIIFGDEKNYGDLMKIDIKKLPNFDLMIAGFPCQTFSIMGLRKGFEDDRGQVIFGLLNILKSKKVDYFLFENVKGLLNIDNGNTIQNIVSELSNIGYVVDYKLLNTKDFGLPQSRERVYIFGYKKNLNNQIGIKKTLNSYDYTKKLSDFLIDNNEKYIFDENSRGWSTFIKYLNNKYNIGKYNLKDIIKENYLVLDTRHSDLRFYRGFIPTLRKGRHGILYVLNGKIRKLSGYESMLLQGFSDNQAKKISYKLSDTKILGLTGNAMSVNVIKEVLNLFIK